MPSPSVEIKNGAAPYVTAVGGVNVDPAATVVIRLSSQTDVDSWSIQCITTDNSSDADTVTASLTIDAIAKTATFTAPATPGKTYRFRSMVNSGIDRNGVAQASYSTTFCLYVVKNGRRKLSADEKTEGNSTFGWITVLNDLIDSMPSGVASGWGGPGGGGGSLGIFGQNSNFLYYAGGSAVGATGFDYVSANGTVSLNRGVLVSGTAVATLANSMLVSGTGASGFVMVAPVMQALQVSGIATLASAMLGGLGTGATGLNLVQPVVNSPIVGGTYTYTGLATVANGNARHRRYSQIVSLHSSSGVTAAMLSWALLDEAVTTIVAEVEAVASGGAGGGSYIRRVRIRCDGGVATMGSVESTYSDESPGPGCTGLSVGFGVSGTTGKLFVAGTATGHIDWGACLSRSETSWA